MEYPGNMSGSDRSVLNAISSDVPGERAIFVQYLKCEYQVDDLGLVNFFQHIRARIAEYRGADRSQLESFLSQIESGFPDNTTILVNEFLCFPSQR